MEDCHVAQAGIESTFNPHSSCLILWLPGWQGCAALYNCRISSVGRKVCGLNSVPINIPRGYFGEMYYQVVSNAVQKYKGLTRWAIYNVNITGKPVSSNMKVQ